MTRPRLLDLFCGEGGAGEGYHRAGFTVYAVDNAPARLKRNPFPSHLGDVVAVMAALLRGEPVTFTRPDGDTEALTLADFDAIHASPPCTGYSRGTAALPDRLTRYDRLIAVTRELLVEAGLPYVIENVEDARPELLAPLMLCGSEFGLAATDTDGTALRMQRHRLFESSVFLVGAGGCHHDSRHVAGAYGGARRDKVEARTVRKGGYVPSVEVVSDLLGIDWMSEKGLFLSIPPAYTVFVGEQLLEALVTA
jgi:DNA (cytosine-5)-methyltransferase 1